MTVTIQDGQYAALPHGVKLHYASAGEKTKPLLLFLHGFPEFWFAWEAQLKEFGQDYFAVAPDLRGFNLSAMPTDVASYKPRFIAQDIHSLITYLGYEQCILVAHDWGGAVAWNMAIAQPELFSKLIILNSPHPYLFAQALVHDQEQKQASEYMNWLRATGSEQALAKDDFALMEKLFVGMSDPHPAWFTDELRKKYHACWSKGLTGGVNYYRASPMHPATEENPGAAKLILNPDDLHCKLPVRVIWGERDRALLPVLIDGLEKFIADLKIERWADASHWLVHEHPDRVNQTIRRFLAE